jgi:hypothetical protein
MPSTRPRLIVGVTGSLTNLQALRRAAAAVLSADRIAAVSKQGGEEPR